MDKTFETRTAVPGTGETRTAVLGTGRPLQTTKWLAVEQPDDAFGGSIVIAFRMADYRKLRVWQRSIKLAASIFDIADRTRKAGHVGLSNQMKESAESIGSNIAEGSGHTSRKEFARYLTYSIASSCEVENQIHLAAKVHIIPWSEKGPLDQEIEAVRKMLTRLRKKVDAS